jgi:hypothetical protein
MKRSKGEAPPRGIGVPGRLAALADPADSSGGAALLFSMSASMGHNALPVKKKFLDFGGPVLSERNMKGRLPHQTMSVSASVPTSLNNYTNQLQKLVHAAHTDEMVARAQLFNDAESMVEHLPLKYLYSKPELRHYAIRRAAKQLIKPALASLRIIYGEVFRRWWAPKCDNLNDRQVGFLVISKALTTLLESAIRKKFKYWATIYSSRYKAILGKRPTMAAIVVQRWYRHLRIIQSQPFRNLAEAIHICLHRRRAIKRSIEFERSRRQALDKIRRGVALRRRIYFAARSIQRIYRFIMLLRRSRWRLTRSYAARKIKAWRKRVLTKRDFTSLTIIRLVLRCGGLKAVRPKLPPRLLKTNPRSVINTVNDCVRQIQRAWFKCCNKFAAFMALAAQRAKEAFEKMLNDMCTVIQNSYRAHLWNKLMKAAHQNLRAIRIQRGFRAFQYRCWVALTVLRGRHRRATRIKKFYSRCKWRQLMAFRFRVRQNLIIFTKAQRGSSVRRLQRRYRKFIVRMREFREEQKRIYEEQKKKHSFMIVHTITLQRFYRQFWHRSTFPTHVLRIARHAYRLHRRLINHSAGRIQKMTRAYLQRLSEILLGKQTAAAMIVWKLTKAYILKLAIHDRVLATRERRRRAANKMKKNFRFGVWWPYLCARFALQREKLRLYKMKNRNATVINMFVRRKYIEHFAPLRVAGRFELILLVFIQSC